jgi:lipoate-protein ligase A
MRPSDCGIEMLTGAWKAPGGLISVQARVTEGSLLDIRITGDFFLYPHEALEELEKALSGIPLDRLALEDAATTVLGRPGVEPMGFGPSDVVNAILGPA